jgi:hypothetical protein
MTRAGWVVLGLGILASGVVAAVKPATIKLRDVDMKGTMGVNAKLTLNVTFDVQKEDLFDEMYVDFYILVEPNDDDIGLQFFHCRSIHRFLEEQTGYVSGVFLPAAAMSCLDASDCEYAVVLTYRGEEVGLESSLKKERWWTDKELGEPIENVLVRSTRIPTVRPWETN